MSVRTIVSLLVGAGALASALPAFALSPQSVDKRKPLRLRETCVTRAERQHVLRFRASDGVRLIGVELGSGPRAVILAHQGGGAPPNLCPWVPYGRTPAA